MSCRSSGFSLALPPLNTHSAYLSSALNVQDSLGLLEMVFNRSQAELPISNDVLPPCGSAFIRNLSCVLFTWGQEWKQLCKGDTRRSLCLCSQRQKSNIVVCAAGDALTEGEGGGGGRRFYALERRKSGPTTGLVVVGQPGPLGNTAQGPPLVGKSHPRAGPCTQWAGLGPNSSE